MSLCSVRWRQWIKTGPYIKTATATGKLMSAEGIWWMNIIISYELGNTSNLCKVDIWSAHVRKKIYSYQNDINQCWVQGRAPIYWCLQIEAGTKRPQFCKAHFFMYCPGWKWSMYSDLHFTEVCFWSPIDNESGTVSVNGLAPRMCQKKSNTLYLKQWCQLSPTYISTA